MKRTKIPLTNKKRIESIKMSGERCKTSDSISVFNCHCNDCYNHIIEYLGKQVGKKYFYTGNFKNTINNREVIIERFCTDEEEETSSCECFVRLANSEYCYEWIPRDDIFYNLKEIRNLNQRSTKNE